MPGMRTVVILATISIGAIRIMWRAFGPAEPHRAPVEWTADE
jgi:hypothetical protein